MIVQIFLSFYENGVKNPAKGTGMPFNPSERQKTKNKKPVPGLTRGGNIADPSITCIYFAIM